MNKLVLVLLLVVSYCAFSNEPVLGTPDRKPSRPLVTLGRRFPVKPPIKRQVLTTLMVSKPDERPLPITPLTRLPVRPKSILDSATALLPFFTAIGINRPVTPDPIRFVMVSNRDSVGVGETVEISIVAQLLPILPSQLFFFETQRSYSLKVLVPEGFEQTGGDYYDYIGTELSAGGTTSVTYKLQGRFIKPLKNAVFTLLRGPKDGSAASMFEKKQVVSIRVGVEESLYRSQARQATPVDTACQNLQEKPVIIRIQQTTGKPTSLTIVVKNASADYEYSADSVSFSKTNVLKTSKTSGYVYVRIQSNKACYRKLPYQISAPQRQVAGAAPMAAQAQEADCQASDFVGLSSSSGTICDQGSTAVPINSQARAAAASVTLTLTGCTNNITWYRNGSVIAGSGTSITVYSTGTYNATCGTSRCPNNINYSNTVQIGGCPVDPCANNYNPNWQWSNPVQYQCNGTTRQQKQYDANGCQGERWVDVEANSCACGLAPNWQWSNPVQYQCNGTTRQQKQYDANGCQGERWVDVEANSCACGLAPNWQWSNPVQYQCNGTTRQQKQYDANGCQGERWVDVEANSCACGLAPNWQWSNPVQYQCNGTTRQQKQYDANGCQGERWVDVEANSCACGLAPNWQWSNPVQYQCNGTTRQQKQYDANGCQGERWVDVEANSCACGLAPNWQWSNPVQYQCNGTTRQQKQYDANGCQGERWVDVEANSCACRPNQPDWQWKADLPQNYRCIGSMRQRLQYDANGCTNQPERWADWENNSCACPATPTDPTFNGSSTPSTCQGTGVNFVSSCEFGAVRWTRYDAPSGNIIGQAAVNPLPFPGNLPAGQYYYTVACVNGSCTGPEKSFTFTVMAPATPTDPTFNGGSSASICQGTAVTFSSSCPSGQVHWKRYDTPGGTMIGHAMQNQLPVGPESPVGQYYYSLECSNSACPQPAKTFTFVIAPPGAPTNPTFNGSTNASICQGTAVTFASSCPTGQVHWKRFDAPGGALVGQAIQTQLVIGASSPAGQYYYSVECSNSACPQPAKTFTFSVVAPATPADPTFNSTLSTSACLGTYVAFASSCPTGDVQWTRYDASGNVLGQATVNPLIFPGTLPAGGYYYNVRCANTSCASPPKSFTFTVLDKPGFGFSAAGSGSATSSAANGSGPASLTVTICNGGSLTLSGLYRSSANIGVIEYQRSDGKVAGAPLSRPRNYVSPVNTGYLFNATYSGYALVDSTVGGTLTQSYIPYFDTNQNGQYDAGDCLGDSITLYYRILPKPVFGFAAAGSSPASYSANTTGPVTNNVTLCSGGNLILNSLYRSRPDIGLLEKSFSSGNVTYAGELQPTERAQNQIAPVNLPIAFAQSYGPYATNNGQLGTIEQWYTPFIDANGNGAYDAGECLGNRITLRYTILPTVGPVITPASASLCAGQSTTLTATGCGGTVTWQGGSTGSSFATPVLTQTTVFTAVCNTGGCTSAPAAVTIVVNELPTATISGNLTICSGQSTTLTASGGSAYRWNTGATTAGISPATGGTYSVTVSNGMSCTATANVTVTVGAQPTASIVGNLTLCSGQSTTLTASGGSAYAWSTGATTAQISVSAAGPYSVTVTGGTGCTAVTQATVTVGSQTTAGITGSLSFCTGQSTTLTASGGSAYRWSTGETTASISVSVAGPYSLTVTGGGGCSATASVTVNTVTLPDSPTITARVAGTSTSQSLTLTAAGCPAGSTVRWSGPNSSTAIGLTWVLPLTQSGTYSARCEIAGGCRSEAAVLPVNYAVPPAPVVGVTGGITSLCAGESTTLTASGCEAGQTVRWSNGQIGESMILTPSATAYYSAACVSGEVLSDPSNQVQISVANSLSVTGRLAYTVGETISLTAVSSAPGSVTYTWSGPGSFTSVGPNLRLLGASVSQAGSYTVVARAAQGCAGRQTVVISVTGTAYSLQTGSLSQTAACAGGSLSVPFSATGSYNADNVFTVQLSAPNGSFAQSTSLASGTTVSAITVTLPASLSSGQYQLRVVSSSPSVEGVPSATTLTVSALPSVTATNSSPAGQTAVGGPLSLSATGESTPGQNLTGATYLWSGPAAFTSTQANPTLPTTSTASNGTYTVTVTTPGGCTTTAQTSVSLASVGCSLAFDGPLSVSCVSTTAVSGTATVTTNTGTLTVRLLNVTTSLTPVVSLYVQTTATVGQPSYALSATATGSPASFTSLTDGVYRVTAYVLNGTDTCRATLSGQTSLTAQVRCNTPELNIRIKSVDATPTETDLLPRVGGGLGTLDLSVEELDGQSLAGYSYLWSEPTSTSATTSTATSTTLVGRRIGEYKVTLTNSAGDTLVAYTTLRAKPCRQVAHTYNCGTTPATPISTTGGAGLSNLAPGDTIRTGDFDVIVLEVTGGSSGAWTGTGYTLIPYLGDNRIAVDFTNASINDCYEYTGGGMVQSQYNSNWSTQNGSVIGETNLQKLVAETISLLNNLKPTDANNLKDQKQRFSSVIAAIQADTSLTETQKQAAIQQVNKITDQLTLVEQQPCLCAPCSATGGPGGRRAAEPTCQNIQNEITKGEVAYVEAIGGSIPGCTAPKPTVAGRDGQLMTTTGTVGITPITCSRTWVYIKKIGDIAVNEGWYDNIEVVIDSLYQYGEVSTSILGEIAGVTRKLTRFSQWFEQDRWACQQNGMCNNSFGNAASFNTRQFNYRFYKPIAQINAYYNWAAQQIEKHSPVRFFHAARDVTSWVGVRGAFINELGIVPSGLSEAGRKSLADVNVMLLKKNMPVINQILTTGNSNAVIGEGIIWDFNYVKSEQTALTDYLEKNSSMTQSDITRLNQIFENSEFLNFHFKLAKLLLGTAKLNYQVEKHRFAIGHALVFMRHADSPTFVNSAGYQQALDYLGAEYKNQNTERFRQVFLSR